VFKRDEVPLTNSSPSPKLKGAFERGRSPLSNLFPLSFEERGIEGVR